MSNAPVKSCIFCSIGLTAFNEEKNIATILTALQNQKLEKVIIDEIIVISSGSTDKTVAIAGKFAKNDKRIQVVTELKRNGKASAVNIFIDIARNDVLILESADTIPDLKTIERLASPFIDENIGITGSHPMPVNSKKTFIGFAVNCLWNLHHEISLKNPKMGETIAFRKSFKKIPVLSAVDEVNIEALIKGQGYKALYIPDAIVRNKGPETMQDFIKQRRRIYAGHLATKEEYSYIVSTSSGTKIFAILMKNLLKESFKDVKHIILFPKIFLFSMFTILLEVYSRLLGYWDFKILNKKHTVWEIAETTKDLHTIPNLHLQQQTLTK